MSARVLLNPGDLKNAPVETHLAIKAGESSSCSMSLACESADCNSLLAVEPGARHNTSHWELKYRVKYKVKQLMGEVTEGPVGCSTPRPGTAGSLVAVNGLPCDLDAVMKRVMSGWNKKVGDEEKKLVERYVCKYFIKLKMKGNF